MKITAPESVHQVEVRAVQSPGPYGGQRAIAIFLCAEDGTRLATALLLPAAAAMVAAAVIGQCEHTETDAPLPVLEFERLTLQ